MLAEARLQLGQREHGFEVLDFVARTYPDDRALQAHKAQLERRYPTRLSGAARAAPALAAKPRGAHRHAGVPLQVRRLLRPGRSGPSVSAARDTWASAAMTCCDLG